ncbi:hypothetical protein TEA_016746 [Camellia sinensis var. sinensis]|uniref:Transmembrane protein n=1 Tax=Camellia sinensis var. sinensis TaxID=542762 RepID=A0A4S4EB88_CAMSN|nr:hypothetical protein TEA_016746 [Camellia sinensis var. sinensis]
MDLSCILVSMCLFSSMFPISLAAKPDNHANNLTIQQIHDECLPESGDLSSSLGLYPPNPNGQSLDTPSAASYFLRNAELTAEQPPTTAAEQNQCLIFLSCRFVRRPPSFRGSRRMMREPKLRVREATAEQIEEKQSDWAYSKPIVILDLLWNFAFVFVALSLLMVSRKEFDFTLFCCVEGFGGNEKRGSGARDPQWGAPPAPPQSGTSDIEDGEELLPRGHQDNIGRMETRTQALDLGWTFLRLTFQALLLMVICHFQAPSTSTSASPSTSTSTSPLSSSMRFHVIGAAMLIGFAFTMIGMLLRNAYPTAASIGEHTGMFSAAFGFLVMTGILLPDRLNWFVLPVAGVVLFIGFVFVLANIRQR